MISPEKQYLSWRRGPAVGCVFARLIATNPARYEQRVIRVPKASTPSRVAKKVATIVAALIADKSAAAVTLVFPHITTLEHTATVILALNDEPQWSVRTSVLLEPPPGGFIAFHLVREIPFGAQSCPSEALVFGNFPECPPTRRSPVTALELFVGELRPRGPLDDAPTTKGNLAHIELHLPTHEMFRTMWENSELGRATSLGGQDMRAKAKVSLVVTPELANSLGCTP